MSRHLHIVALDSPWPADYGGAIDMFCRIAALHAAGIRIHLHYFSYKHRGNPTELNRYCESIHVYERKTGRRGFSTHLPYIVSSRISPELVDNLNKDEHPVLLEGVHCSGIISQIQKNNRKILVRLHNDESAYYKQLAKNSSSLFRKLYYHNESRLLKKYQSHLPADCLYACITSTDSRVFRDEYGIGNALHLPAFVPYEEVKGELGIGNFCLYHGNLSVAENEKAAVWLLTKVFPKIKMPMIVAGKDPSRRLKKLGQLCQHTCLVENPSSSEINDLVRKAHINILPSFSTTGIKLKLLHALFEGRHCVTNDAMVAGTGLEAACHSGNSAHALAAIVMQLRNQPYTNEENQLRKQLIGDTFNNERNAQRLIQYLW